MASNKLTNASVRAAAPRDRPYKLFDGEGLFLHVMPSGTKTFRWGYRPPGSKRQQTATLGRFPDIGLAEARRARAERAGLVASGKRITVRAAPTLRDACDLYWQGRTDSTDKYRDAALGALERHIYPDLGDVRITDLTRPLLLETLLKMQAKGLAEYTRKCRTWLSMALHGYVALEVIAANPADAINPRRDFNRKPKVKHFARVELHEVPELARRLALESPSRRAIAAHWLLALTWTRTDELRGMRWSEIDGDTWRIDASRMKRDFDHMVPLTAPALQILKKQWQIRTGSCEFVFPNDRRADRAMSENTILNVLYEAGYKGRMTGHGWRSIGSSWANENGCNPDAIEAQLAHVPGDKVRAAYNRANYIDHRRDFMNRWAIWLLEQGMLIPA